MTTKTTDVSTSEDKKRSRSESNEEDADLSDADLHRQLYDSLRDCSRQRLRSLQMVLRKNANFEGRVSSKDLMSMFQECQIKMTARTLQTLVQNFEDKLGIDYEKMWKTFILAHKISGRDSVEAQYRAAEPNLVHRGEQEVDLDLERRLREQMLLARDTCNLEQLRDAFKAKDKRKDGRLDTNELLKLCGEHKLPIYGSLLNRIMQRCEAGKSGQINWPDFMSFMEKANDSLKGKSNDTSKGTYSTSGTLAKQLVKQAFKKAVHVDFGKKEEVPSVLLSMRGLLKAKNQEKKACPPSITLNEEEQCTNVQAPKSPKPNTNVKHIEMKLKSDKITFYPPDSYDDKKIVTDPPQERLKFDWIYGYRGVDRRCNIHPVNKHEILYFVGRVCVIYDKTRHCQRNYKEHNNEISSIALHSNCITVASGQIANRQPSSKDSVDHQAHIRLWRVDSMLTLHKFGAGFFNTSILSLSFAVQKEWLCAIDSSSEHTISIWNTGNAKKIAQNTLGLETVYQGLVNNQQPDVITVVGKEHLAWWKVYPDQNTIEMQSIADYQNYLRAKFVTCCIQTPSGDVVTGDSNGTVYVWSLGSNIISNLIKHAHNCPLLTLHFIRDTILLTGGRDGVINAWFYSKNMEHAARIQLPVTEGGVRCLQQISNTLLIGTTTNSILTACLGAPALRNPFNDCKIEAQFLTQGHCGQISDICSIPSRPAEVVSVSLDGCICAFDSNAKLPIWKWAIKDVCLTCIDVNDLGTFFVTGDTKGYIGVFYIDKDKNSGGNSLVTIGSVHIENQYPSTVKICPDNANIAVGCRSGNIYVVSYASSNDDEIYDNDDDDDGEMAWRHRAVLKAHTACIDGLDWSQSLHNNEYFVLRSCCSSKSQLYYWQMNTCKRVIEESIFRNVTWNTNHCLLNFHVSGIWYSKQAQSASIRSVDVHANLGLLAMADSRGYIGVFRYPCTKKGFYCHTYHNHTSVNTIRYTQNGKSIFSIGSPDSTIIQWKLVK